MTIRLIASDLDGTLFGPEHTPEPRTVAAVNAARDAGLLFVAATGRSHYGGAELAESTGASFDWFIGSNGGHRLNMATREVEERLVFDAGTVQHVIDTVRSGVGDIGCALEFDGTFFWDDEFMGIEPLTLRGDLRVSTATDDDSLDDVGKIMLVHRSMDTLELVDALEALLPAELNVATAGIAFVEVTPAGATKGESLARLAAELGVDASEAVTFGDNQNDITMLEWAGRGIAMGNALDLVKAAADETTLTNTDFGVAAVVEQILADR